MSDPSFQTFLVGGLLALVGAIVFVGWSMWRYVDRSRDMEALSLQGVGHEMRIAVQRMLAELGAVAGGETRNPSDLLPISHPQIDAVLSRPCEADRRALTVLRAAYDDLDARKQDLRNALKQSGETADIISSSANAVIDAIAILYLWEEHDGKSPLSAPSTRSWHVRDWMKAHGFSAHIIPGLHLRDEVVERLRAFGMTLTPKPLTYTASQYYAKLYDRKADPNAPFWKRKTQAVEETPAAEPAAPKDEPQPELVH